MARVVERPKARQELEDIAVFIGRRSPSAALRLLAAARKTFDALAAMPEMGAVWETENIRFQGLRHFPIVRYPSYVIFYRPLADGVEVLHVLRGTRDVQSILHVQGEE